MRFWLGRGLQALGLAITGFGCVLFFWKEYGEGPLLALAAGGLAVFWIGCRVLGVSAA
jgi:hypothetical protein